MLASIFWVIIDRQKSFLFAGFSRVSNCHCTRKGLAEYPCAPATQTMSPFPVDSNKSDFLLGEPGQDIEGNAAAAVQ